MKITVPIIPVLLGLLGAASVAALVWGLVALFNQREVNFCDLRM